MDNKKDIKIIDTKAEQQAMGVAIAKGILKTLEIPYEAKEEKLYRVLDGKDQQAGAYSEIANALEKAKEVLKSGGTVKITYGQK